MLYSKHKPGALIVVHENDLAVVATELAAARDQGPEPSVYLQDPEPSKPSNCA
jgi:hypothetical protein